MKTSAVTPFFCWCTLFLCLFFPLKAVDPDVKIAQDVETFTLDNGIVSARVSKVTGDLVSFRYKNVEMFATSLSPDFIPVAQGETPADNPNWRNPSITGRQHAYWSHDAMGVRGSAPAIPSVTVDPKNYGGDVGEVSVKAISNGRKMGTGPGASADGQFVADIEIRYALERGEPGIYTYSVFVHKPEYPVTELGEARFCAKLAPFFDWMSVDPQKHFLYPKDLQVGDKYIYTVPQWENRAFGWSSTTRNVGLFFINPSMEYMSGGPTKVEFLGHRDTNAEAAATVLNYWRSSHYGGAEVNVAAGEAWEKVVGPMFIYANSGPNPDAIFADARARATLEAQKWPYHWVKGVDYPLASDRATVSGRMVLKDPITPKTFVNLTVGLTAPAYESPRLVAPPVPVITDWQRDGKFYQFWVKGNPDGTFALPAVRPGRYTLHAFADGVLGEFIKTDVVITKGGEFRLGKQEWIPLRKGSQLWDIGIANRSASEFFMAEKHVDPEISLAYGALFPNDVQYTIGKSNFRTDWFFQHVPHNENPEAKSAPFYGANSPGRATPYTVNFELPSVPKGTVILRLAICGTGTRTLDVTVNGKPAGKLDGLVGDGVITRHGLQGIWYEKEIAFDGALLQKGTNQLVLMVPAGPVNNGIMYDYIRLEISD